MKHFYVVLDSEGSERYRMKQWLRENPDKVPDGCDATQSTSHQLRSALRKENWSVTETPHEVLLAPPGVIVARPEPVNGGDEELLEAEFTLEYQLRDFLAENLEAISVEGKKLRLYVDPTGREGVEFPTAVGRIDILAVDETDALVVFELKRAHSPDRAIGQLSRYMGWVKQTIGKGKQVRGVIVAKTISENLRYAVAVISEREAFSSTRYASH